MKVTLPDLTTIDCTVDEYEELISRGLVGKKLEEMKIDLGLGEDKKITLPRAPKYPPAWDQVVALYGCEIPSDHLKEDHLFQYDPTKLNATVLDANNEQKDKSDDKN